MDRKAIIARVAGGGVLRDPDGLTRVDIPFEDFEKLQQELSPHEFRLDTTTEEVALVFYYYSPRHGDMRGIRVGIENIYAKPKRMDTVVLNEPLREGLALEWIEPEPARVDWADDGDDDDAEG